MQEEIFRILDKYVSKVFGYVGRDFLCVQVLYLKMIFQGKATKCDK